MSSASSVNREPQHPEGSYGTTDMVVAWSRGLGHRIAAATVRSWAHRGHLVRYRDTAGQTTYDLDAVAAHLTARQR